MDLISYSLPLGQSQFNTAKLALNSEILVAVYSSPENESIEILALNRATGNLHALETDIPCRFFGDDSNRWGKIEFFHMDLTMFLATPTHYGHYTCSQGFLPYSSNFPPFSSVRCSNTDTLIPRAHKVSYMSQTHISRFTGVVVELLGAPLMITPLRCPYTSRTLGMSRISLFPRRQVMDQPMYMHTSSLGQQIFDLPGIIRVWLCGGLGRSRTVAL